MSETEFRWDAVFMVIFPTVFLRITPKSSKSQVISVQPPDEKTTYEQKIMGRMTLHKGSGLKTKSGLETQGKRVTQLLLFFFFYFK